MSPNEKRNRQLRTFIFANGSYKIVALFVTLILWFTIMIRRDFDYTKEVPLEVNVGPRLLLAGDTPRTVKVTVEGPRAGVRQFQKSDRPMVVDLTHRGASRIVIRLGREQFSLPDSVKILKIEPPTVDIKIVPQDELEKNQ